MHAKDVDYAILSSFRSTFFFVKTGDTLYMSRAYQRQDTPIFATFCFVALALGLIGSEELLLPVVTTDWWPHAVNVDKNPRAGVDTRSGLTLTFFSYLTLSPRTLPVAYKGVTLK